MGGALLSSALTNGCPTDIMVWTQQCPAHAGIIGNRVEIPGDPVTVSGERAADAIAFDAVLLDASLRSE